ncbi:MAG: hypothetical protein WDN69_21045 [Aliidongia sp.]
MRLSISSSDRRFIGVLALWTAALVVAANLLVAYGQHHWVWLERRLEMPNYDVPANIQDYVLNYRRCPIVVLGSRSWARCRRPAGSGRMSARSR